MIPQSDILALMPVLKANYSLRTLEISGSLVPFGATTISLLSC
jgi:hypothetical protein